MHQVGHRLGRVVDITLKVYNSGTLWQHSVLKSVVKGIANLFHIGMAFAQEHIVTDADNVG